MLYERLTETDTDAMARYITEFGPGHGDSSVYESRRVDGNIVFNPWDKAKSEYLYDMLGQNFIVKKDVKFTKEMDEIVADFYAVAQNDELRIFRDSFYSLFEYGSKHAELVNEKYTLMSLVDFEVLAKNTWPYRDINITFPGTDKAYKITKGMKVMKILSKFAEVYHLEGFENFRLRHSQILNQKELHGTLCLSIHPLDYMTMSDNASGWESCMSWVEDGDYRMGTVEMMNSEKVIIAYLDGATEFHPFGNDFVWSNKKWRQLIVVTPELITTIKGYPYQSNELSTMAVNWIVDLAKTNLGWNYDNSIYQYSGCCDGKIITEDGSKIGLSFMTNTMYNDFGTLPSDFYHLVKITSQKNRDKKNGFKTFFDGTEFDIEVNYSGEATCMWCGGTLYNNDDSSNRVICLDCAEVHKCSHCGYTVDNEYDLYEVDGEFICRDCYDDYCHEDIFGEVHFTEDMTKIYVAKDKEHFVSYNPYIYVYDFESKATQNELNRLFVNGVNSIYKSTPDSSYWFNRTYSVVNAEDLTSDGLEAFGYSKMSYLLEDI